ncbi:MAG: lipid II:glycine glycyltransferase FemX [Spirochaetota bacterium]
MTGGAFGSDSGAAPAPTQWHFLQSDFWAHHKTQFGWTAVRLDGDGESCLEGVLSLSRSLPGGVLFTYVPYAPASRTDLVAPGVPGPDRAELPELLRAAVPAVGAAVEARIGRAPAIIRFDLPQTREGEREAPDDASLSTGGPKLMKSPVDVQPPDTVVLDLREGSEALLAGMHKKNRYNIRLAERKGVSVREAAADELPRWYALYEETAARDGITIHSYDYYARLFELASGADAAFDAPALHLSFAEHEGELLAGIVVAHYAGGATYLYGASSNAKRNLMPNYALQWRAIEAAARAGCSWYDMFGVPPADDPAHPMHGLYRFKTGFGGSIVHRLGAWDAPVRPIAARVFRLAERGRDVYFHGLRGGHAR